MPLTLPTFPGTMTSDDLQFSKLIETLVTDYAYFGVGEYTEAEVNAKFASKATVSTEIAANLTTLGELAEKPTTIESKASSLPTRNYAKPGKRTNTVTLKINGLSAAQKKYLESDDFSGKQVTIVFLSRDHSRVTIFNGIRCTMDWKAVTDELYEVSITTQFVGGTNGRIYLRRNLA